MCAPTTGELLGEVALDLAADTAADTAVATCWALPHAWRQGMTTTALAAVVRFGLGGLGLERIECPGAVWQASDG